MRKAFWGCADRLFCHVMVVSLHFWSISEGLRVNFRKPANFTTVKSLEGKFLPVPLSSEVTLPLGCRDEQGWAPATTQIPDYVGEFRGSKGVEYKVSLNKKRKKEWGWIKWALKCNVLFWRSWLCASVSHTADEQCGIASPILKSF